MKRQRDEALRAQAIEDEFRQSQEAAAALAKKQQEVEAARQLLVQQEQDEEAERLRLQEEFEQQQQVAEAARQLERQKKQAEAAQQQQELMRQHEEFARQQKLEQEQEKAAREIELVRRQEEAARQEELQRQEEAARQEELQRQEEIARQRELQQQQEEEAACRAHEEATRRAQEEAARRGQEEEVAQEKENEDGSVALLHDRFQDRVDAQREQSVARSLAKKLKEHQTRTSDRRAKKLAKTRGIQQPTRPGQFMTREQEMQYTADMARAQVKYEIENGGNPDEVEVPMDETGTLLLDAEEIENMGNDLAAELQRDVAEFQALSNSGDGDY